MSDNKSKAYKKNKKEAKRCKCFSHTKQETTKKASE